MKHSQWRWLGVEGEMEAAAGKVGATGLLRVKQLLKQWFTAHLQTAE